MSSIQKTSSVTIPDSQKIETKEIDEINKSKFFNKKRVVILIICLLICVALLGLTIKFVLNIDFANFGKTLSTAFSNNLWIFFVIILFNLYGVYTTSLPASVRLRELGYKPTILDTFLFNTTFAFLSAISPANLLTDPFLLFWIKSFGVSNSKAIAILSSNGMISQLIAVLITIPSFGIICTHYNDFMSASGDARTPLCFWLIVVGLAMDTFNIFFFAAICFSKNLSYTLSLFFNKVKKILHFKYHTKAEIKKRYLEQKQLRQDSFQILSMWKGTLVVFIKQVAAEIISYSAVYFLILWVLKPGETIYPLNFGDIFNCANVAVTANKMVPLPGGNLSYEFIITNTLRACCGSNLDLSIINESTFIGRCFGTYILFVFGLITSIPCSYLMYRKYKKI